MKHYSRNLLLLTASITIYAFVFLIVACDSRDIYSTTPHNGLDEEAPSPIFGLVAIDTYRGTANLSWDKSINEGFDRYEIYVSTSKIEDTQGLQPVQTITDSTRTTCQVTGLEEGTTYYFAVLLVDTEGNKITRITSEVSITTAIIPEGRVDPDFHVDIFRPDLICEGTTFFPDNHIEGAPRIVEVNILGELIWEYKIPDNLRRYTNPGFDAELLSGDTILFLLPRHGVLEIDRTGTTIWSYPDKKVSHDADRLPDGNTIVVFGANDTINDAHVKEINPEGQIVWSWLAKDHFNKPPYKDIYEDGWLHTNAVTRLSNGNTLVSPRNFNVIVELSPDGSVIRTIGEGIFIEQHDPELQPNGNILAASHNLPQRAIEIDTRTDTIIWEFLLPDRSMWPVRDADRLPNGNTLITGTTSILEVSNSGEIVWQLSLNDVNFDHTTMEGRRKAAENGFYKAQRVCNDNNH